MESNQESTSGFLWMKNESGITSEKTSSAPAGSAITSLSSAHLAGRWVQEWWWSTGQQFSTKEQQLFLVIPIYFCFTAVFWAIIWKFVSCTLPHTTLSRHFCFLFSSVLTSFETTNNPLHSSFTAWKFPFSVFSLYFCLKFYMPASSLWAKKLKEHSLSS